MLPHFRQHTGILYGLAAFLWWGLCPIYFKAVDHVPSLEVLAHRVLWSWVLLSLLMVRRKRLDDVRAALATPRVVGLLAVTTLLVALNWFVFIWAVANDRVLEASLGYFINPLVNVLLGLLVLRERLRARQWLSVALAFGGVAILAWQVGSVPAVSLILAGSFGLYGLFRKMLNVGSMAGLTVETLLLAPVAVAALVCWHVTGRLVFAHADTGTDLLLVLSGVVTAVPLVWFAAGARRLTLATLGFLQYTAPTGQFLLAVLAYGEPLGRERLVSFGLIWIALAVFSFDAALVHRRQRQRPLP